MNLVVFYKLIKFIIVGFSGLLVDFGITYFLKEKLKVQKYIANAIGFITAATSNYFFNRFWTFKSNNTDMVLEYGKFIIVSAIGLLINTFVIWILVNKFKLNFYFSKLIAILVVTIWNFSVNLMFTFA